MKVQELIRRLSVYDGDLPVEVYDGLDDRCYRGDFTVSKHTMRSDGLAAAYEIVSIGVGGTESTVEDDLLDDESF